MVGTYSFDFRTENLIDLMQSDVNNAFAARTCIAGVVVTNESNMASYFPEAGNLNSSIADMCSDMAGPCLCTSS